MIEAPSRVRARLRDGTEIPLECVYEGWSEEEGLHVWVTAIEVDLVEVVAVMAETIPAKTTIHIRGW